jgi:ketosteroid isomerase-like protein
MLFELPKPIAAFFAAQNGQNADALAHYFADDAVVRDEGRPLAGLAAIEEWKAETKRKYQHTTEPLSSIQADGKTVVTSRVTGNFPGSPVELRFAFRVEAGRIASLEIH